MRDDDGNRVVAVAQIVEKLAFRRVASVRTNGPCVHAIHRCHVDAAYSLLPETLGATETERNVLPTCATCWNVLLHLLE